MTAFLRVCSFTTRDRGMHACTAPGHPQARHQLVAANGHGGLPRCERHDLIGAELCAARAARIGGVAAPTEPPRKTAAQIERNKLEAQQRQLQAKVAAMQSAAAATQGGVGLSDGGAKLRARMEGAAAELSAVEQALANIAL